MNDTKTILQMAERIHELQEENKNQKIITDSYIQLHKEAIERVVYLDGLTNGDVGIITKLQVENGELKQKLKTGSRMLDDWEKSTTHPDSTLVNIRNLKKVFTQNTEANRA